MFEAPLEQFLIQPITPVIDLNVPDCCAHRSDIARPDGLSLPGADQFDRRGSIVRLNLNRDRDEAAIGGDQAAPRH